MDAHIPVTYCPRAYPRAPLVEDVDADSLISENRGRQCVLYVDQLVVLTTRVVVRRLDAREVVAVRPLCELPAR